MITKDQAYEILGVTDRSLDTEIEKRYSILIKRYGAEQNAEKLDEISLAYNIIKGTYFEPIKENPRMKKIVFGKTRSEWKNIWVYGKVKYFVILCAAVFLGYIIYTVATNTPPDFKVAAVGVFSIDENKTTEQYIANFYPQFKKVGVELAQLDLKSDSPYQYAYVQKALITISVAGNDVLVVDHDIFAMYAKDGAFMPIGDLYDSILALEETNRLTIKDVTATIDINSDGSGTKKVYGIDLSDSQLLNAIGIYGRDQILVINSQSKRPDLARDFITKLFKDTKQLLPKVTLIPSPTPSPVPTVTVKPAP